MGVNQVVGMKDLAVTGLGVRGCFNRTMRKLCGWGLQGRVRELCAQNVGCSVHTGQWPQEYQKTDLKPKSLPNAPRGVLGQMRERSD